MIRFFGRSKDKDKPAVRVLLVCMGNICRSPMAEGVLRQRLAERNLPRTVEVDSAGTHGYHEGSAPDSRAQDTTLRRGVDISGLRARRVRDRDFERFDLVLAMDEENLAALTEQAPDEHRGKIRLLLEFAGDVANRNVPDPYYGGMLGFERVLDLVEEAMAGLLDELERRAAELAAASAGEAAASD